MLIPTIGTSASWTFSAPFNVLDGIYTLKNMMSFDTALSDGVNLFESLYEPAEQTEAAYNTDWENYKADTILKLVKTDDPTVVYYVPDSLLASVPDPQIIKVHDLYLAIDLGLFQDPAEVTYMISQLDDVAASVTGTAKTTQVFTTKTVHMTKAAYQAIVDGRAGNITGLEPQAVTIQTLLAEVLRLQTLNTAYEETLKALQAP